MNLGDIVNRALHERRKLREQGFDGEDLDLAFEKTVRDAWPKGREWFYICTACNDTGWEQLECLGGEAVCGPSTYQPAPNMPCPKRPRRNPHAAHSYVRQCFCDKGRSLKSSESAGDFSQATKAKPRKFSRFGND